MSTKKSTFHILLYHIFDIIVNKENVGHIYTKESVTGDLVYDLSIDNKYFDDYVILFAVAVDKAFGEFNKDIQTP